MSSRTPLAALSLLSALLFPLAAQAPTPITSDDVFAYLTRAVAWYQQLLAIDKGGAITENLLQRGNSREAARRTMQASFAFATAEAATLSSALSPDANAGASKSLEQSLNKSLTRVTNLEARLQSLDARIAQASGAERNSLVEERAAIAADLALAQQIQAALKNMTSYNAPKTNGRHGLLDEIAALEEANRLMTRPPGRTKGKRRQAP